MEQNTKCYKELLGGIRAFVFDVDGVMTDGSVIVMPSGEFVRTMNTKDGYAMQLAVKNGFKVIVITGGNDRAVLGRLNKLGVTDVVLGTLDKLSSMEDFMIMYNLSPDQMVYMGDDIPDLPPMKKVILPACPSDAVAEVRQAAGYVSPFKGGQGCVRDIIEQVMKVQGLWGEDTHTANF